MLTRFLALMLVSSAGFAQTPTVVKVSNAASLTSQLSPGVIAAVYGTNFGSTASALTVTVGGKQAYVVNATAGQLIVQIPAELSAGTTTLTVGVDTAVSAPFNITLAPYAPAFITQNGVGTGPAAVFTVGNDIVTPATPASPGDMLYAFVIGLGPTAPPTPTGVTLTVAPTATVPNVTVGGMQAKVLFAGVTQGVAGSYRMNFIVPPGVQGTQPLVVSIGGVNSPTSVTLPLFGITTVVNNASFGSAGIAAPGSFVTLYGNGLGSTDQVTGFPATKFQGVQVTFNGTPAPLYHLIASNAQAQQIDLLVPNELPTTGTVNVQLTTPAAFYPNYTLNMVPAAPGVYRIVDPNVKTRSNVIAQFNNTVWLAMPASMAAGLKLPACGPTISALSLCGQPATIGDYLVLYVTGLGITTPNGDPNGKPLATGVVPPADGSVLYKTPVLPTVTVGGIPAKVLYSGLPPGLIGEYQIDIQVPSGVASGDDVPVVVTMLGASDTATISIQPRP